MITPEHEQLVLDTIAGMQAMNIVVFGPRIAVIRDPEEERTKGGLYIPEEGKRKEPRGTVVAVGVGVDTDEVIFGFQPGDRVLYTKYNPIAFKINLPSGETVDLELMHVNDLYIGWRT
jgi:chaperonin GroES